MNAQLAELISAAGSLLVLFYYSLAGLGWVIGLILILLLSAKELLRSWSGPGAVRWPRTFDRAIVPLLLLFLAAVAERTLLVLTSP